MGNIYIYTSRALDITLKYIVHGWGKDPKHYVGQCRDNSYIVATEFPCISLV